MTVTIPVTIFEILAGSLVIAWMVHSLLLIWFQGSMFARLRSWLEAQRDIKWWAKLLTCSLCLSVHVAFWVVVVLIFPWYAKTHTGPEMFLLPFYWSGGFLISRAIDRTWHVNPAE